MKYLFCLLIVFSLPVISFSCRSATPAMDLDENIDETSFEGKCILETRSRSGREINESTETLSAKTYLCGSWYYLRSGEKQKAYLSLRAMIRKREMSNRSVYDTYDELYRESQPDLALLLLTAFLETGRDKKGASLLLSYYYLSELNYKKAAQYLDMVLEEDPKHAEALYQMGFIYFQNRDYKRSASYLALAEKYRYDGIGLPLLLAQSFYNTKDYDEALKVIDRVPSSKLDDSLIVMKGKILLLKNWNSDLSYLVRNLPAERRKAIYREWFGKMSQKERRAVSGEFLYFY